MTQYTYFQQAAGLPLPVPSVEITYGLERIMTALQVRSPSAQRCKLALPYSSSVHVLEGGMQPFPY